MACFHFSEGIMPSLFDLLEKTDEDLSHTTRQTHFLLTFPFTQSNIENIEIEKIRKDLRERE